MSQIFSTDLWMSQFSLEVLQHVHKQKSASRQKLTYDTRKMTGMTTTHMTSQKHQKLYYVLKYEKAQVWIEGSHNCDLKDHYHLQWNSNEMMNTFWHFRGSGFPPPDKYRHIRGVSCFHLLCGFFYPNEWWGRFTWNISSCLPNYTMSHPTWQRSSLLTFNKPTAGYS